MQLINAENALVNQFKIIAIVAVASLGLSVLPAAAQVSAGLNEVGGKASIEAGKYSNEEENLTTATVDVYYGRFFTNRLEVGPSINFAKTEGQDVSGAYSAFADYHFGATSKKAIPYVELAAGQFFGSGNGKPTFVAIGPGLKWFFANGGGALNGTAFYRHQFLDDAMNNGASGSNEFVGLIGVAIYFGR